MFPSSGSNFQNDIMANVPSQAMMMMSFTPTFGNVSFTVTPPAPMIPGKPDQVQAGFPSLAYFPLEALLYQGQQSNPQTAPVNTLPGNSTGAQNTTGQQTIKDGNGNTVYLAGFSTAGF